MNFKIGIILFFFPCWISCKGQHNNSKNVNTNKMDIPTVNKDFETFNNSLYDSLSKENPNFPSKISKEGAYVEMLKANSGLSYRQTMYNSYFTILKVYYINGNIKSKGAYFNVPWGGFRKGTWFEYSEAGKLVRDINYDKDYKFTFEQLLLFCRKEGIDLNIGPIKQSTGYHTMIRRVELPAPEKAKWTINWLKKPDVEEIIILDGTTGKILSRTEQPFINN